MSRSYKKTAASPICSSRGDKEDRSIYHRAERRKVNSLLNEITGLWDAKPDLKFGDVFENDICMLCMDCNELCEVDFDNIEDYTGESFDFDFNTCYNSTGCGISKEWEIAADKIITKGIDYSLTYADRWSWGSDGGSYWSSDKSEMRKEFDKVVFGVPYHSYRWIYQSFSKNEAWNDYLRYREAAQNKKHSYYKWRTLWNGEKWLQHVRGPKQADSDWNIMEMLFYRKVIPFSFWGPEDFIAWMRAHEEEIIELALKMRYKRK